MEAPALEIRDITYSLNGKKILEGISWTVKRGEHWVILGPNGAGKTTLLKILCGYLWPNGGGEVFRQGQNLLDLRELRKSIGWVTNTLASSIPGAEPVLQTVLSGKYAQIGFWRMEWEAPGEKDLATASLHLEEMGCAHLASMPFGALSQGEQQKVMIARALMTRPYLIILDEPCAGLDPGARETFLASLQALGTRKGAPSLIYVTHHLEEIMPIFGKTLILKEGRAIACGKTDGLLHTEMIEELYGISMKIVRHNRRYWPLGS